MLGQECEKTAATDVVIEDKVIQPIMVVPIPSPDCAVDWNYNEHGKDWKCRCNEGRE